MISVENLTDEVWLIVVEDRSIRILHTGNGDPWEAAAWAILFYLKGG